MQRADIHGQRGEVGDVHTPAALDPEEGVRTSRVALMQRSHCGKQSQEATVGLPHELCCLQGGSRWSGALSDPKLLRDTVHTLSNWGAQVVGSIGADGIYLFGSLLYRDGEQFITESDIDLALVFPDTCKDAVARLRWTRALAEQKIVLENELALVLDRHDRREILCSIILLTRAEIGGDIHKDGAEGFFTNNLFMNLLDRTKTNALPGAGQAPVRDRLIRQCLRFAQKN